MQDIIGDYKQFVKSINQELDEIGIKRSEVAMIDHLCYRVETEERYRQLYKSLSEVSEMIGEVEVRGRLIATFEPTTPLEADGWFIPYIELPAPKNGSPYSEGLEHAELVTIGSLAKFQKRHAHLNFDEKGLDRTINPELSLKTDRLSVKFHEQPLGAVVRIEERLEKS